MTTMNAKNDLSTPTTVLTDLDNNISSIDSELLPINKCNEKVDESDLNEKEILLRNDIICNIEKAQYHTVSATYYYIKVGAKLILIKNRLSNKRYLSFINSIGFSERTAQRYCKIAKDKRFAQLTENEIKKVHHLTQNKMVMMTKFSNDDFDKALNDSDYQFKINKKTQQKPKDYVIDNEKYNTFTISDKAYIINEYNSLLQKFQQLEKENEKLSVNSNNTHLLYQPTVNKEMEIA